MMMLALKETGYETRVAITPQSAKTFAKLGFKVAIEAEAGQAAGFNDEAYEQIGAQISKDRQQLIKDCQILLCVNEPKPKDLAALKDEAIIIGPIDANPESPLLVWAKSKKITVISMNLIPRISRAQNMDSLSSQANVAGYRAVLAGVNAFHRVVPMMMTAAGMIQPAKVLVLGAGVAGLQAIATAKRLGAVVYAFDVRRAAKEQVESLGAEFIEVAAEQNNETQGGYASEPSEEYKQKQGALIDQYAKIADIVISTALIPGRKAPILIHKTTVEQMKPGSVIVDLATSRGGNCEVSEMDKTIDYKGVTIIGHNNLACLVPATASELYANNLAHLLQLLAPENATVVFNPADEIIQQAVLCHQGSYLPFQVQKESNHA